MNNIKVYISGKIGEKIISEATRRKFAKAEEVLKAKGFDVFNPCSEEWEEHLRKRHVEDSKVYQPYMEEGRMPDFYTYALLRDQMALATKDAICLLPDWKDSPGAKAELAFAHAIGLKVYELTLYDTLVSLFTEKEWCP